jgi:hypothetical protein
MLDQVKSHRHVGKKESTRIRLIRTDTTNFRRKVKHDLRSQLVVHALHIAFTSEVECRTARQEYLSGTKLAKAINNTTPEETGAPRDHDASIVQR